jgi:hypothetical protein
VTQPFPRRASNDIHQANSPLKIPRSRPDIRTIPKIPATISLKLRGFAAESAVDSLHWISPNGLPLIQLLGRNHMKTIKRIIGLGLILFAPYCLGSEMLMTLEQKVLTSDLVVIGTVTDVHLGEIRKRPELLEQTQDTKIRLQIDECIAGNKSGEISIEAHSVSFFFKGGWQSSTAGFTNGRVKKNERFIAYLKESKEGYVLAGESIQYLEWIDEGSKTVTDIGQTSRMVPIELKRKQLLDLAAKRQKAQQAAPGQPATRPLSK